MIVVAGLFLLLGLALAVVVGQETPSSEGGLRILQLIFLLIWVTACLSIIVFYLRLLSKGRTAAQSSLLDLHIDATDDTIKPGHQDIEARLRTLERLKSDGLITGEEYRAKREQILQEKW
jgi:hypothetical protein